MRFTYLTSALLAASATTAAPTRRQAAITDADILQYALTLEHLENVFYKQALSTMTEEQFTAANYSSQLYNDLKYVAHDEEGHVMFLTEGLTEAGAMPVAACTYNFGTAFDSPQNFVTTAATIEGVGVSAYLGGAAFIQSKKYLTAAGAILVTEALHQSLERVAIGEVASANIFGTPLGLNAVYTIASSFIVSCPESNAALPVKAYPSLTLDSGSPTSTEGATVKLMPASAPSSSDLYATFVSGLDIVPVAAHFVDNAVSVEVPMNISGQSYVFLTSDNSGNITDSTVLAGPAILQVTPSAPTFDVNYQ